MTPRAPDALPAAVRDALAISPRWIEATRDLPTRLVERVGPVDLEACSEDELLEIASWAMGKRKEMPAHLVAYLGAVREATR
jgi:hypothetical protein